MLEAFNLERYVNRRHAPALRIALLTLLVLLIIVFLYEGSSSQSSPPGLQNPKINTPSDKADVSPPPTIDDSKNPDRIGAQEGNVNVHSDTQATDKDKDVAQKGQEKAGQDVKGIGAPKWARPPTYVMPDPVWDGWSSIEHLFVFGDSTTDTGFLLSNDAKLPGPGNPFGNHDRVPKKVFAPKWPNFLAETYNQSTISVWNLAWDGSTTDKDVVGAWALASSLTEEVEKFSLAMGGDITGFPDWKSNTSLFAISIGINDINLTSGDHESDENAPIDDSVKAYRESLEKLYQLGARNYLLLNSPALHLARDEAPPELQRDISKFNTALDSMRAEFVRDHKRYVTAFSFDLHKFMEDIAADPSSLPHTRDIKDTGFWMGSCNACIFKEMYNEHGLECSDDPIHEHMFCEAFHPTYVIYNASAAAIATDCFQQTKTRNRPQGYCS